MSSWYARLGAAVMFFCVVPMFAARQTFLPGPSFEPDTTLTGSSLSGWRTLGDAEWQMTSGNLTGTPGSSGAGGWLAMNRSFQDVELFTRFQCTGGCVTGILFRIEKTPDGGMKGVYASLSEGKAVMYFDVTVDAQGRITDRTPLRSGGGKMRVAPPASPNPTHRAAPAYNPGRFSPYAQAPGVDYPYTKPDSSLYPDEWNDVEMIFDANILRVDQNNGRSTGGVSDSSEGYGPIAFYVGGSGKVEFKDIAYKDIHFHYRAAEDTSPAFRKQTISDFYYSWGAASADFNHDGIPDIVSGPYIYLGPDYTKSEEIYLGETVNPSTGWATKSWMEFAADFTGDGWPDVLACKFIDADMGCYLYVNPKGESRRWDVYRVLDKFDSEVALLRDIDGKGKPALVYAADGYVRYAEPDPANPTGPWTVHNISERGFDTAHGIGVGDINGDGLPDIMNAYGWWEHPAPGNSEAQWKYHPEVFGRFGTGVGGSGMAVYDVNGDGLNDIVTVLDAHGWGMAWFEQKRDAQGNISFIRHMIMDSRWTKNAGNIAFSEAHGDVTADINGDGIPDFVVGKRYFTHLDDYADPDPYGSPVLYWYETVRDPKAPGGARFAPHLIDNRSGSGSDILAVDLNHDGRIDIVTATRLGTFIFWNNVKRAKPQ
uniref:DUF1080 domain-containing protein n=2 Tax=Paracidobacterium acidisoli TaxID=2303751 RepID=A0A372ILC4_9BACT